MFHALLGPSLLLSCFSLSLFPFLPVAAVALVCASSSVFASVCLADEASRHFD